MAEAVEDPRSNEDPNNAGDGEEGEDDEFGGVFVFRGAVREKLQFAFLLERKKQRLSVCSRNLRGAELPTGGREKTLLALRVYGGAGKNPTGAKFHSSPNHARMEGTGLSRNQRGTGRWQRDFWRVRVKTKNKKESASLPQVPCLITLYTCA